MAPPRRERADAEEDHAAKRDVQIDRPREYERVCPRSEYRCAHRPEAKSDDCEYGFRAPAGDPRTDEGGHQGGHNQYSDTPGEPPADIRGRWRVVGKVWFSR